MSEKDLIPLSKRTKEEQKKITSKGGKASGAARRKKRDMKQCMELLLSLPATSEDDRKQLAAAGMSLDILPEDELINIMVVNAALLNAAKSGDVAAVKELRSIIRDDEKIKIERERLALEKKKIQQNEPQQNGVNIIDDI